MKYILLIYHDEQAWNALTEAERQDIYLEYRQLIQKLQANAQYLAGDAKSGSDKLANRRIGGPSDAPFQCRVRCQSDQESQEGFRARDRNRVRGSDWNCVRNLQGHLRSTNPNHFIGSREIHAADDDRQRDRRGDLARRQVAGPRPG